MVLGVRLVKVDVKKPMPVPFDVLVDKAMVGFGDVDQTIPLAVMAAPASEVILPPDMAEVAVFAVIAVVVSVGIKTIEEVSLRQRTEAPKNLLPKSEVIKPV